VSNPLFDKHERPAKRIDCGSGKYVALSEGGTFALYYPDGDLCRYLDPYLESELADRLISLVSAGTSVEAQLDRVIASHETYENAYRAFRDLAVWGKTEYKPISDEDRELALSCYRLGHGSPISTGEFTKHPRCANGCETARKWGTKPCEGFCEWLPQKTASPIDAGAFVKTLEEVTLAIDDIETRDGGEPKRDLHILDRIRLLSMNGSLVNAALSAQPVAWRYRWKNGGEWKYTDYPTDINTSSQYEAEALYARMPSSTKRAP
jgi:hypothetical protein